MKSSAFVVALLAFFLNHTTAAEIASSTEEAEPKVEDNVAADADRVDPETQYTKIADFCFFAGTPPSDIKYTIVKKLKVAKGSYGGVKDILPKLVDQARKYGADAVINYSGSQRFGFFPWRTVRPVVRGVAIKWEGQQKPDCAAIRGTTLKTIIDTDRAPEQ